MNTPEVQLYMGCIVHSPHSSQEYPDASLSIPSNRLHGFDCTQQLWAQQEITLKTGTKLLGNVTVNNRTVKVEIGDSEISFSLDEVEKIGPVDNNLASRLLADRLLMLALESRLNSQSAEDAVRLFGLKRTVWLPTIRELPIGMP